MTNPTPTYEQYLEAYVEDKQVTESYELENEAWDQEKSIGCGNTQTRQKLHKIALTTSVVTSTIICPPVGIGMAATSLIMGSLMNDLGERHQNQDVINSGEAFLEAGSAGLSTAIGNSIAAKRK